MFHRLTLCRKLSGLRSISPPSPPSLRWDIKYPRSGRVGFHLALGRWVMLILPSPPTLLPLIPRKLGEGVGACWYFWKAQGSTPVMTDGIGVIINPGCQSRKVGRLHPRQALGEGQDTISLDSPAPTTVPSLSLFSQGQRSQCSLPAPAWASQPLGTGGDFRERVHALLYGVGPRDPGGCLLQGQGGVWFARPADPGQALSSATLLTPTVFSHPG